MKNKIMLVAIISTISVLADVEYVDNVAWSYNIVRGNAHIYGVSSPAPVTSASDTLTIPSTLGGCPVVEIEGGITVDWNVELAIPATVTSVRHFSINNTGYYSYTNRLQHITIDSGNAYYKSIDGCLYTKDGKTFVRCPQGRLGRVTVASGVKYIADNAFRDCFGVTEISLPDTIISVGQESLSCCRQVYESNGYQYYTSLTNVNIPSSIRFIGDYAFQDCSKLDIDLVIPEGVQRIGAMAFSGCSSIRSLSLPSSLVEIGHNAFKGCSRMTVSFSKVPSSILIWNINAFTGCDNIKLDYEIKDGVKEIPDRAFYRMTILKSVTIPNSVTNIGNYAFYGCSGLTSITIPNSVTSIGSSAFYGCSGLTSITRPNSVTSIGNSAFSWCKPTSVTVPGWKCGIDFSNVKNPVISEGTTNIVGSAFEGCSGVTSVTIPDSVTSIGPFAFEGCSGLTSVTIPNSVTNIGSFAFYRCNPISVIVPGWKCDIDFSNVKNLAISEGTTNIVGSAFRDCSGLTSVTIGNSVTSIGDWAFLNCRGLTSVTIGNSVTSIGSSAFYGCSGLTSVTIPDSVTSIGSSAFYGCTSLTTIKFNGIPPLDFNLSYYPNRAKIFYYEKYASQWSSYVPTTSSRFGGFLK